jgi:hypothetical protein
LVNPKTENYKQLKSLILDPEFNWRYHNSTGMPFYSHTFLTRPEGAYSKVFSEYLDPVCLVVDEILSFNNIRYKFFLRSNANCVHADNDIQLSEPHVDHEFPHINVILYLTNTGGKTYCEEEFHDPKEDDVLLFTGEHWMERPKLGRRVILINTLYT